VQTSPAVLGLPSLHAVPSLAIGLEQAPVPGAQVPAAWHWSVAGQANGAPPTQAPAWHWSLRVQALPSLQAEPSGAAGFEQAPLPGSQAPAA
jgi:hypothetical protein